MEKHTVTNEMLYELIKGYQTETNRRFEALHEEIGSFKADTNRRFDDLRADNSEMKAIMRHDHDKLQQVYESRDRVAVSFTRAWLYASFFIAILASTLVLAVEKALS